MERDSWSQMLLLGPRGRRFCLWASGVHVSELLAVRGDTELPATTATGADEHGSSVQDFAVGPGVVTAAAAAVARAWTVRRGRALTEEEAFGALADTAARAMYWQPPDDDDQVVAEPVVAGALADVAATATASPATGWWDRPTLLDDQHYVSWIDTSLELDGAPPALTGSTERLRRWRELTAGPPASLWWSFPDAVSTSASRGPLPATQLALVEDTLGCERARVARLEPGDGCRVLELVTPQDWVSLVEAYPLDVTRARDDYWPLVTGGQGPWFLPDWYRVSRDYDAVHLTVLAYLSTAGRALACPGGATVLAGWEPDVTYWLTDTLTEVETPTTWTTRRGEPDPALGP